MYSGLPHDEKSALMSSVQSWDFHATTPFNFFSAMYFLIARRLLFLLRFCQSFRASCFMLILLARRDKPAGCLRTGVPPGLESCVAVRKFSHQALIKERPGMVTSRVKHINPARFAWASLSSILRGLHSCRLHSLTLFQQTK